LLGIATISSGFNADGHFVATACVKVLGIAALVWLGAHIRLNRWMAAIAGFLGGISYSLYLIHQSVGYVLIYKMEEAGVGANLAVWATVVVMVVFAYLIRAYIEIPAQNWIGRKYAPWKTPRPALAAADPA
jgi:peptidoglycan/LPS O-acetylase OafA/YrhL